MLGPLKGVGFQPKVGQALRTAGSSLLSYSLKSIPFATDLLYSILYYGITTSVPAPVIVNIVKSGQPVIEYAVFGMLSKA